MERTCSFLFISDIYITFIYYVIKYINILYTFTCNIYVIYDYMSLCVCVCVCVGMGAMKAVGSGEREHSKQEEEMKEKTID